MFGSEIVKKAKAGIGMVPSTAMAVRLADRANAYVVAMNFTVTTGIQGTLVGVWTSSGIVPGVPVLIYSVDGSAKQFTDWPSSTDPNVNVTTAEPAVGIAQSCLPK